MSFSIFSFGVTAHELVGCVSSDNRRTYRVGSNHSLAANRVRPGPHSTLFFGENYSGFQDEHYGAIGIPGFSSDQMDYAAFGVGGLALAEHYDRAWFITYGGPVHMALVFNPSAGTDERVPIYLTSVAPPGTYNLHQNVGDLFYVPATNTLYGVSGSYNFAFGMDGTSLKAIFQTQDIGYDNASIALSPDLTKLYVANDTTMVLRTIDTTTGAVSAVVGFGSGTGTVLNIGARVRAHADGRIFVGYLDNNYHQKIARYTATGALIGEWTVSDPSGIPYGSQGSPNFDISHDGTQILTHIGAIISTVDGSFIDRVLGPNGDGTVNVAPNGERCYIEEDLRTYAIQGSSLVPALSMTAGTWGSIATLNIMSVPLGSTINFLLNYPFEPSNTYQLAAATGRDNPIRLPRGREVGIDRDATAQYTIRPNRPEFTGFHGALNTSGAATMNLSLDPAIPGVASGSRLYVTATTFAGGLRRLSAIQSIANVCIIDIL